MSFLPFSITLPGGFGSAFLTGINANLQFDSLQGRIEHKSCIREKPARIPASWIKMLEMHFLPLTSQIPNGFPGQPAQGPW
jgi:hypothetical protein